MDAVARAYGFVPNLAGIVATSPALAEGYLTLMLEPGDGRVTKPSLLARQTLDPTIRRHRYSFFPLDYSVMFCDDYDRLTGNINFQDNLLNILLSRDTRVPGQ
jgi:hypothetical protein